MGLKARTARYGWIHYLLTIVQMCFLTPRPVRADDVCSSLAPVCIREVDSTPLGERLPLILIHGLNTKGFFAPPQTDTWDNFLNYHNNNPALKAIYKPYLLSYYSNAVGISDLGGALCDVIDKMNQGDQDNFGNKNIVLVGHSMGGLVARNSLVFQQNFGAFNGKPLGERVPKIITLATPHHGSPLANGPARDWRAGVGWGAVIGNCDNFDLLFWSTGPGWNQVNRSDLRWDNYDGLLNYDLYPDEGNFWLDNLNQNQAYDSKIIAYGGAIAPGIFCGLDKYCWGTTILGGAFGLANDGVVPLGSAQFEGHSVVTRYLSDYNHSEMAKGKDSKDVLFERIRDDLLNIERLSDKAILISPSGYISTLTPTYSWSAVLMASQYYLEVNDSTGTGRVQAWYTAKEAGCASGTGICSVTPATALANGAAQWRIQARNDSGDGPWSEVMGFTVAEGLTWLSFAEGNPGVPGDGLVVNSACGQFWLNPVFPLKGTSNGLTLSIFPTSAENLFAILYINKGPRSDGLGALMVLTSPATVTIKDGTRGIFFNITQSDLQQAVKIVNLLFTNYTLDDLDITGLEITASPLAPCSYHAPLDAVAIGQGQNVVP